MKTHNNTKLKAYLNSLPVLEQDAFAKKCNTSLNYLRKAIYTNCRISAVTSRLMDEHSGGKVPKQELRPDVWPELLGIAA